MRRSNSDDDYVEPLLWNLPLELERSALWDVAVMWPYAIAAQPSAGISKRITSFTCQETAWQRTCKEQDHSLFEINLQLEIFALNFGQESFSKRPATVRFVLDLPPETSIQKYSTI